MRKALDVFVTTGRYLIEHRHTPYIEPQKRSNWAHEILDGLNLKVESVGVIASHKPTIYVANHIGYIDIPVLMSLIHDCVFVSKKEVAIWPILGQAAKKIGTVFVKRNSKDSRHKAREEIMQQLSHHQKKLIIFPSGTTSITRESHWNKGIFEIAEQLKIPLQPIRIQYSHLRAAAYIDQDRLLTHLIKLSRLGRMSAHVEFHTPMKIHDVIRDLEYCRSWCSDISSI